MTIRILLFSLLPLLSFAQSNSKVTIQNNKQTSEKGPLEPKRNTFYNLDEIKVRWKKAALENCPMVVCPTSSVPGPCTTILATPMGPSSANVSFVPPTNDGGSPITGYIVTATPTSSAPAKRKSSSVIVITGTSSPILVTGLSFGINYIFSVLATNAIGGSPPITTTTTVTPCILNIASPASTNPTLDVNTVLTPTIMVATTGATGIATATGLPAGVTAGWSSNLIMISGTPTATGTFNYTIPLTGGCGTVNATGTITVTAANTAGAASSSPTLCISNVLTNITHTTTGATGIGSATGLPAGVSSAWASNTITISGIPTVTGTFNYSIPLTGGYGSVNATGTITVAAVNTVSTASSTPAQCISTTLTNITHTTIGVTGIGSVTGLPNGVSAAFASNTITISGTPSASGIFSYSIPLTGGCGSVNATGTITVCSVLNTAGTPSTSPTLVVNSALTPITISTTGATGIGTATGLPAGVNASWMSDVITIRDTPTVSGTFNYTIPLTGGCGTVNATGTMTVIPACPIGKDTIWDFDNNSYNIVAIGTQCWTKENLRVRKYNDGTSIVFDKTSGTAWVSLDYGAHSIYNHDSTPITGKLAIYGYLYNWYAAKGIASPNSTTYKNICPSGWHIPTDSDWNKLVKFLDSGADTTVNSSTQSSSVGGMLKSTLRWNAPNTGATSTSVFAALPGGFRGNDADFFEINVTTFFWSTTENVGSNANPRNRYLRSSSAGVERLTDQKSRGGYLRCLKD